MDESSALRALIENQVFQIALFCLLILFFIYDETRRTESIPANHQKKQIKRKTVINLIILTGICILLTIRNLLVINTILVFYQAFKHLPFSRTKKVIWICTLCAGMGMNQLAMLANGGKMPTPFMSTELIDTKRHSTITANTKLLWLCDIFLVSICTHPGDSTIRGAYSAGDILIYIGLTLIIWYTAATFIHETLEKRKLRKIRAP